MLCSAQIALGNPGGENLVHGLANFHRSGNTLQVQQLSQNAIINWESFGIPAGALTQFLQPSASSAVLNRVVGGNPSEIYGTLQANGQVFLINPNGIVVGPSGVVNVGSFVASTQNISNEDFLAGNYHFAGNPGSEAGIVNLGQIQVAEGGSVALLAKTVENTGTITAEAGSAVLAGGTEFYLGTTDGLLVLVDNGQLAPGQDIGSVTNTGLLEAARIALAAAGGNPYAFAVQNGGTLRATGFESVNGHITLTGGAIHNSGSIEAPGGTVAINATAFTQDDVAYTQTEAGPRAGASAGLLSTSNTSASVNAGAGGHIDMQAGWIALGGTVEANGLTQGGRITLNGSNISLAERISARGYGEEGTTGTGGTVHIFASGRILETSTSSINASGGENGGSMWIEAGGSIESSGKHTVNGDTGSGGSYVLTAPSVRLLSARITANGLEEGGTLHIGGEYQGGKFLPGGTDDIPNAVNVGLSGGVQLRANAVKSAGASGTGKGGTIITWADDTLITLAEYSAQGSGGFIEISAENLTYAGSVNATAGTVLFDPKNITIQESSAINQQLLLNWNYSGSNIEVRSPDFFGEVSLDGNRLAIGAVFDDGLGDTASNTGAVYLFTFSSDTFSDPTLEGIIGSGYTGGKNLDLGATGSGYLENNDLFGRSPSLDGTNLAVGATGDDGFNNNRSSTGTVYLFNFADDSFSSPSHVGNIGFQYVGANDYDTDPGALTGQRDWLGTSVALEGRQLAIGVQLDDGEFEGLSNSGAVHLFNFADDDLGTPNLVGSIGHQYTGGISLDLSSELGSGDLFGTSVSIDNNRLVVGAEADSGSGDTLGLSGAVYLFEYDDDNFTSLEHVGTIGANYNSGNKSVNVASLLDVQDRFGKSVSLSGRTLAVGASKDDGFNNDASSAGAVHLFSFNSGSKFTSPQHVGTVGKDYAGADDFDIGLENNDTFAYASVDSGRMVIGAPGDGGVDNGGIFIGAVYTFTFAPDDFSNLELQGILGSGYSSQTDIELALDADDFMGEISLDGLQLAIASPFDDGFGESSTNAGAVYLYTFADETFKLPGLSAIIGSGYIGGNNLDLSGTLDSGDNFGRSVDIEGGRLAVGATGDDGALDDQNDPGAVYLFSYTGNFTSLTHEATIGMSYGGAKDVGESIGSDDFFGSAVSLSDTASGTSLAVGARRDDGAANNVNTSGAVYLYTFTDDTFGGGNREAVLGSGYGGLNITQLEAGDLFGAALDLDGSNLIVSAEGDRGNGNVVFNAGGAYLISFDDDTFTNPSLVGQIGFNYTSGDGVHVPLELGDQFGTSVSLDGNQAVITAKGDDGSGNSVSNAGAAYIFTFSSNLQNGSREGVIGAGYTGSKDTSLNLATDDLLSYASLSNNRLVLAAPGDDGRSDAGDDSGALYFLDYADSNFNSGQLLTTLGLGYGSQRSASNNSLLADDYFGVSVSLDGSRLAIGASGDDGADGSVSGAGAVYLYEFTDSGSFNLPTLVSVVGDGYTGGKNLDVTLAANDRFGFGVSLDSRLLAVGAPGDDGALEDTSNAGAVYLISFTDEAFSSPLLEGVIGADYGGDGSLALPSLEAGDKLGEAVSLDNFRLVAGAPFDDGGGNTRTDSGAVYTFTFNDTNYAGLTNVGVLGRGYGSGNNFSEGGVAAGDYFGSSVSLYGRQLAVGAYGDDGKSNVRSNVGAVYGFYFGSTALTAPSRTAKIGFGFTGSTAFKVPTLDQNDWFGKSVSVFARKLVVGAPFDDGQGNSAQNTGAVYTFTFTNDSFGGTYLNGIIGEDYTEELDLNFTYGRENAHINLTNNDNFGTALALEGTRLVVGVPQDDGIAEDVQDPGAVYFYSFSGSSGFATPTLEGRVGLGYTGGKTVDTDPADTANMSVSLTADNRLAIGGAHDGGSGGTSSGAGAVQLYSFADSSFTTPSLDATVGLGYTGGNNVNILLESGDAFGSSVSLLGTQLAVGAPGDDGLNNAAYNTGAVYLINFAGTAFSTGTLAGRIGFNYTDTAGLDMASTLSAQDAFGSAVSLQAISGGASANLAVGTPGDDGSAGSVLNAGAVHLFTFSDTAFASATHTGTLGFGYAGGGDVDIASLEAQDRFGSAVSLNPDSADKLAVGTPGDDGSGNTAAGSGAVQLFTFTNSAFGGGNLEATAGSGYAGGNNFNASSFVEAGDAFGSSVALSAQHLRFAVGTPGDDGSGNTSDGAGAVHVFNFLSASDFSDITLRLSVGEDYATGDSIDTNTGASAGFGHSISLINESLAVTEFNGQTDALDENVYLYTLQQGNLEQNSAPSGFSYSLLSGEDFFFTPRALTDLLNAGTNVRLQASNDITVASDITASAAGAGGNLQLDAGRSIAINANVTTDGGDITFIANDTLANGVVDADRDAGSATLGMQAGTALNAGTGNINLTMRTGAGKTNHQGGDITLADIATTGVLTLAHEDHTAGAPAGIVFEGTINVGSINASVENRIVVDNGSALTATGAINFTANAAVNAGSFTGISVQSASVESTGGAITFAGTGGDTAGFGVNIKNNSSVQGAAGVTFTGVTSATSGGDRAIDLRESSVIDSSGGDITFIANTGHVGDIPVFSFTGAIVVGTAANSGTISITADDLQLNDITFGGTGTLVLQPFTAGTSIGLAGAAGSLSLSTAELNFIGGGFSDVVIGSTTGTGLLSINAHTFTSNLTLRSSSGNVSQAGALSVGANDLNLAIGGTYTQGAALTAGGLAFTTAANPGTYTLTNAGNAFTTLAGTTDAAITLFEADGFDIGTVGSDVGLTLTAATTLQSGGAITQSQRVDSSAALAVETLDNAGSAITLNNASNDVASIAMRTLDAAGTAAANANITFTDGANSTDIAAVETLGNLSFTQTIGALTDSGTVDVGGDFTLAFTPASFVTLDSLDVDGAFNITANAAIAVTLANAGNLNFGTSVFNNNAFITSTGGDITDSGASLNVGGQARFTAAGDIDLDTLNVTGGQLALNAGGSATIVHTGALEFGGTVTEVAGTLDVDNTGAITQSQRVRAGTTVLNAGAANDITLSNSANRFSNTGTLTINTANNVTLHNETALALAASTLVGDVTLDVDGTVSQTGALVADGLELLGSGPYVLNNVNNNINTFAANTTGDVTFYNQGAIEIGTVNTVGVSIAGLLEVRSIGVLDADIIVTADISADTLNTAFSNVATVVLASDRGFDNSANQNINTGSGHYLIYSNSAETDLGTLAPDDTRFGVGYPSDPKEGEGAPSSEENAVYYQ